MNEYRSYVDALIQAKFIAPTGYAKGMPLWLEPGLVAAQLLVDLFAEKLKSMGTTEIPEIISHPMLVPEESYHSIYGRRQNVYSLKRCENSEREVVRPDNMMMSVTALQARGKRGPMIAVGGLLRPISGNTRALFRDQYIWPAVQTTELVDEESAEDTMHRYRQAIEAMLGNLGLPTVTITVPDFPGYSRLSWLVISYLPSGRPTVLATLYILARRFSHALGVCADIIDVGFTGKILAVVAQHHRDRQGLALPSVVAPVQVALLADERMSSEAATSFTSQLQAAGLRVVRNTVRSQLSIRRHAERRWQQRGTPLIIGVHEDGHVGFGYRCPVERGIEHVPLQVSKVIEMLQRHDSHLLAATTACCRQFILDAGILTFRCMGCAQSVHPPVIGWVIPECQGVCRCGTSAGRLAFISETSRIY